MSRSVDEGDWVEKGKVLATLDDEDLCQRLEVAQATLKSAQARLEKLLAGSRPEEIREAAAALQQAQFDFVNKKVNYERTKSLFERGVIPKDTLDRTEAAFRIAEAAVERAKENFQIVKIGPRKEDIEDARAQVEQAKANFKLIETPLSYTTLYTSAVQAMVETTERELGPIDILVNNAATFARGEVARLDPGRWNDVIATNLPGPFLVTRATLPGMLERRRGSIVFVSSTSGKRGDAGMAAYCASKFGLMGMAHSLLYEVRRHDIRVIVVSPSAIDTGRERPAAENVTGAQAHAADVADCVLASLSLPGRALVREIEIWGTNP